MSEQLRKEFEEWLESVHWIAAKWDYEERRYPDFEINLAYKAWQAARAVPEQKVEEIRPFGGIKPTEGEQYFVVNPYSENGITRGYYTGQSDRRATIRGLAFCSPDHAALVADAIFVMTELRNQPGAGEQKEGDAWVAFLSNLMRRGTLMRVLAIGNWANGQRANEIVNSICPPFPSQELLMAALNAVGRDRVERALRVWAMLPVALPGEQSK